MSERIWSAALATIIVGALAAPADAMSFVSCIRASSEFTFRAQHLETVATGAINSTETNASRWPWGPELYAVVAVKVLELGQVPPDTVPPEVGSTVNLLQRTPCERCDVISAEDGIYSRTGDTIWFKAEVEPLPDTGSHLETIEKTLLRAGISYQLVVDDWCGASMAGNNWTEDSE